MVPSPETSAAASLQDVLAAAATPQLPDVQELELAHVFVVFRHGDRSPITRKMSTKMRMTGAETNFWISRLADMRVVNALNSGTKVVRYHEGSCDGVADCHSAQYELPPPPQQGGRWPCGQLTAKGVEMMRAKGEALRLRYGSFLCDLDPVRDVHVQSTNISRTIRSAQSLLAGLFPAYFLNVNTDNQLAANAAAREASASAVPENKTFLCKIPARPSESRDGMLVIHADDSNSLAPQHSYDLYKDLGRMLAEELDKHAPPGFVEASQHISEIIGVGSSKFVAWTGLREVLVCRQAHSLAFPDGLDEELFAQICDYDAWLWHHLYGKRDFCRSSFSSGVQRVYSHLTAVTENKAEHKFSLLSAHDNSLVALVKALQLQVAPVIPPYGAMLTFEVLRHRVTSEFYLCVAFEGVEVTFAGHEHSALCPFAVFRDAVQSFLLFDDRAAAKAAL